MTTPHPLALTLDDGRRVPCRIRVSRRCRGVRMTLTPQDGLIMVTPPGVERKALEDLAHSWRGWVAKQLKQMGIEDVETLGTGTAQIPECIELRALGETWHLIRRYAPRSSTQVRKTRAGVLLLSGNSTDAVAARRALERWLIRRAREVLPLQLAALAEETGLTFRKVSIRAQRSRWGSCSAEGDISLNYQILFLPPELARHVLIHELCHTVRLDHSPRFWKTVQRFEPELPRLRAAMHRSWSHVPPWLAAAPGA